MIFCMAELLASMALYNATSAFVRLNSEAHPVDVGELRDVLQGGLERSGEEYERQVRLPPVFVAFLHPADVERSPEALYEVGLDFLYFIFQVKPVNYELPGSGSSLR